MDSYSLFRTSSGIFIALVVICLTACQSSSHVALPRSGGFIRELASNSVFVAEYQTKSGDLTDVREYRLDGQMPVLVLVDKNHDGYPDLLLRQDGSTGIALLMMSDADFDGRYDTFAVPGVLTLKDVDGDGWPEDYWKGYRRPATTNAPSVIGVD